MAACASAALLAALREFWCFLRALGQNLLLGQTRPQLVAVFELSLDCACLRHINADATNSTTILTSMSQACPRFAPLRACSRRCLSRRRSTKDLCPAQKGWPACDPSSTSPTNELQAFLSVHRISLRAYLGIRMLTFTLQNDKAPAQKR